MIDTALRLCKPCKAGVFLIHATQNTACAGRGSAETTPSCGHPSTGGELTACRHCGGMCAAPTAGDGLRRLYAETPELGVSTRPAILQDKITLLFLPSIKCTVKTSTVSVRPQSVRSKHRRYPSVHKVYCRNIDGIRPSTKCTVETSTVSERPQSVRSKHRRYPNVRQVKKQKHRRYRDAGMSG
jgi:hypothetical protein